VIQSRRTSESGFTLIELLVVILIIGILAAIAIPTFLSQRGRAQDTAAKEYTRTAAQAMEMFRIENQTYNATAADLEDLEPSLSEARNFTAVGTADTFTVSVDSMPGENGGTFSMERASSGITVRTCANHGQGGCRDTPDGAGNYW
jgi:type IV pilus assembly protein PilA